MTIDVRDLKILAELMENANASFVEIGKKLDIHPNVVAYRKNKLERIGVIKRYTTTLNLEKLGISENICIGISFSGRGRDDTLKQIASIPQVKEVMSLLGYPEGMVYLVGKNKIEVDTVLSRIRDLNVKIEFTASIIKNYKDDWLLSKFLMQQAETLTMESSEVKP